MENSRSGSGRPLYIAREELRSELATPIGMLVESREELVREIKGSSFIITVGDIVTLDVLESGMFPDLSIIDFMTKRMSNVELRDRFSRFEQEELTVINPPGQITEALWNAIEDGINKPRKLRIIVEGEEDLASLACIALAKENTTVIYGIPNRGASVHHVDKQLKRMVKDMLDKMEA